MATPPRTRELIGWPLLPVPDANGEIHFPDLERSVRDAIEVILSTRPGEQLMRPEFGGGLADFLYEANTLTTRRRIRDLVLDSLERWERRILVDRVEVWEIPEKPSEVRVEIAYRLRRTGAQGRVALSMELAG